MTPLPSVVVPGTGIEPVRPKPRDFKSLVSTYFTIRANAEMQGNLEARAGVEPTYTDLQSGA